MRAGQKAGQDVTQDQRLPQAFKYKAGDAGYDKNEC